MTISVRMDSLLERELELVAKQRGITKSQFIIEAVERALGHKDPYKLLLQVREEEVLPYAVQKSVENVAGGSTGDRVGDKLKVRHAAANADWLAARNTPPSAAD